MPDEPTKIQFLLDRCTEKPVSPENLQAFVRLCLNGNPYWVRYYGPGNLKATSTGHVTQTGRDNTREAHGPYWLDPQALLDPARRRKKPTCLGLWSRSEAGTYRFLAYDIEPVGDSAPDLQAQNRVYRYAKRVFDTWKQLKRQDQRIVGTLLVRSSEAHYHVWIVLAEAVPQEEHDKLLAKAHQLHGQSRTLDKDTGRAKRGKGDCFRLPWTVKDQTYSPVIQDAMNWQRLRRLARALPEPQKRSTAWEPWKTSNVQGKASGNLEELVIKAIIRYPVTRPGQRNREQARFLLHLANKGLREEQLLKAGVQWAEEYADQYEADLQWTKQNMPSVVQAALEKAKGSSPSHDWFSLAKEHTLTLEEKEFLKEVTGEDPASHEWWFCEAILLHSYLEVQKRRGDAFSPGLLSLLRRDNKKEKKKLLLATNQQLARIIEARHSVLLVPMQVLRLKRKFISARDSKGIFQQASVSELWREEEKGHTGKPSSYRLTFSPLEQEPVQQDWLKELEEEYIDSDRQRLLVPEPEFLREANPFRWEKSPLRAPWADWEPGDHYTVSEEEEEDFTWTPEVLAFERLMLRRNKSTCTVGR